MAARIVEVCDAVVAVIAAAWSPTGNDTVSREYDADIDSKKLVGRKVYVFPASYANPEPSSRSEDFYDYAVAVMVSERYEDAGRVPNSWVDDRIAFTRDKVYEPLSDARTLLILGTLYPLTAEVDPVYDVDELRSRKLFVSVVNFTFRESVEV